MASATVGSYGGYYDVAGLAQSAFGGNSAQSSSRTDTQPEEKHHSGLFKKLLVGGLALGAGVAVFACMKGRSGKITPSPLGKPPSRPTNDNFHQQGGFFGAAQGAHGSQHYTPPAPPKDCKPHRESLNKLGLGDLDASNLTAEQKQNIKKNFKKWALRNHPDKGGDTAAFQAMSNHVDELTK